MTGACQTQLRCRRQAAWPGIETAPAATLLTFAAAPASLAQVKEL
jgi:hypothetical protein